MKKPLQLITQMGTICSNKTTSVFSLLMLLLLITGFTAQGRAAAVVKALETPGMTVGIGGPSVSLTRGGAVIYTTLNETSTISIVDPVVTVTSLNATTSSPTNLATVNYTLTLSEAVTGVTADNFELETTGSIADASVGTPVADGNNWTIPVNTGTGDGTITLKLVNSDGLSMGLEVLPYSGSAVTIDKTAPTFNISQSGTYGRTNVQYYVTYSGQTTISLTLSDITVNTTGTVNYTGITVLGPNATKALIRVTGITGDGILSINIAAGTAADEAGNLALAYGPSPIFTVDNTEPVVSNIQYTTTNANAAIAVTGDVVTMTFTTNEPVTNNPSIVVAGVANSTLDSVAPNSYSVSHTVQADDPKGPITFQSYFDDKFGNSTTLNETSTISIVDPVVTVTSLNATTSSPTNRDTINYNFNVSGVITGLTASNFELATVGNVSGATIGTPVVNGNNWTIPVYTGTTTSGIITLKFINTTGIDKEVTNTLPMAGSAIIIDKVGPAISEVVYATTNADNTKAVAGDVVTMNFTVYDPLLENPVFTIAGVGGHTATRPDCDSYSVSRTIQAGDPVGPITFAAQLKDLTGNITNVNETSTISIPLPVVEVAGFSTEVTSPSNAATINYTLAFSGPVTGLSADNFELVTGLSGAAIGTLVNNGDNTWTIPVNTGTGSGSVGLRFINDTGLNATVNSDFLPVDGNTVTIDKTAPTFNISQSGTYGRTNVQYFITYSGQTTISLTSSDITVNATGTVNYTGITILGPDDNNAAIRVTGITGDGILSINIAAGTAADEAGNLAPAYGPSSIFTIDNTPAIVSDISFTTSNANQTIASTGDVVSMLFTLDQAIANIYFNIAGRNGIAAESLGNNNYKVSLTLNGTETPGAITFSANISEPSGNVRAVNQTSAIIVQSVTLNSFTAPAASNANIVNYTLAFSDAITGVAAGNFFLSTSGITGASIGTPVADGNNWVIPVNTGTGNGTLQLYIANKDGFSKAISNIVPYTGPVVTIDKIAPVFSNVVFATSNANPAKAIEGDTVTMTMTSTELLDNPDYDDVMIIVGNSWEKLENTSGFNYKVTHVMNASDPDGFVNARFSLQDVAGNTTDFSQTSTINYIKLSDVNTLSDLSISPGGVTPAFNSAPITDYFSYNLTGGPATVTAVPTSNLATVTVNGHGPVSGNMFAVNLANGSNTVTIVVKAENGSTKTYTITASVMGDASAILTSLLLDPNLYKNGVAGPSYRDYVATTNASSIKVTPTSQHPGSAITVNGDSVPSGTESSAIALNVGPNTIKTVVTSQDGITTNTYSIVITRKPGTNASLDALVLDPNIYKNGVAGPNYRDYTASVSDNTSSITVTATAQDPTATVKINDVVILSGVTSAPIVLNPGVNTINTVVTAADGVTTKTYSIVITRRPSNNAVLANLELDPNIYKTGVSGPNYRDYTASVSDNTSSITVTATAQDPTATVKINDKVTLSGVTSAPIVLNPGVNTINTVVTAADGVTTKTYSIVITRRPSNNAVLANLELDPNIYKKGVSGPNYRDYTASVSNTTKSIKITATTQDAGATVKINDVAVLSGVSSQPILLTSGLNTINTVVTAADGTTIKTYSIVIIRKVGTNALLSSLTLDPNIYKKGVSGPNYRDYTASVSNSHSSVEVYATPQDPEATVKVNGRDLMPGRSVYVELYAGPNSIATVVTAADGTTTKTYRMVITRAGDIAARSGLELNAIVAPDQEQQLTASPEVIVSKALSPNSDGINDVLEIAGISAYPDNTLQVMNSKGTSVTTITGYDNLSKAFDGRNQSGALQPAGTYFYMLQYKDGKENKTKSGYFVLKY